MAQCRQVGAYDNGRFIGCWRIGRYWHDNQTYPITGPQALTMSEVAAILSDVTGTAIRYQDVPPEAARQAQLNAGMPPYLADALAELFAERRAGKESVVSAVTPALLGRPATSFAQFAARNAAAFRGAESR